MSTSGQGSSRAGILQGIDSLRGQESYRRRVLVAALAVVGVGVAVRFGAEVQRLLFETNGPLDLLLLRRLIRDWFADVRVYVGLRAAVHPPATFLLLWPLAGWGPELLVRWWYLGVTSLAIVGFAGVLLREARPETRLDRAILAAVAVASYPVAITIGNGQITPHVLLPALAAVLVAARRPPSIPRDAGLAGLSVLALVKPNLTLPLFWVVAFTPGWVRPAALGVIAYLAASAVSIALHGVGLDGLRALVSAWLAKGEAGAVMSGYGNLHRLLGDVGLDAWVYPASALAFLLHGVWAARHRDADLWVRIGVAAIVARVWAYHRVYDDLLLVLPLVALYRIALDADSRRARPARALFLAGCAALFAPITPIVRHAPWALVALWIAQLVLLARAAGEPALERTGASAASA